MNIIRNRLSIGLCLLILAGCANTGNQAKSYTTIDKKPTLAHDLLALERRLHDQCGSTSSTSGRHSDVALDKLLDTAVEELNKLGVANWTNANEHQAIQALQAIDRSLSSHGFVVCIRTQLLSQAFVEPIPLASSMSRSLNNAEDICHIATFHDHRIHALKQFWEEGVRPVDCDLGALLYLSVAERVGLPIYFLETPEHNLVRWRLSDGTHINWDNNDGAAYSDDEVRNGEMRTARGFTELQENRNRYLVDRTRDEVIAYYTGLFVSDLNDSACIVDLYETATSAKWLDTTTLNNYAWAFSTVNGFQDTDYVKAAVGLAERATERHATCNRWDTLSCAYAADGQFKKAIEIERDRISSESPRIPHFSQGKMCYDSAVADDGGC